jgi:exopolysaccharide biosynthesis polyprenyl glycosylphosphotransferase
MAEELIVASIIDSLPPGQEGGSRLSHAAPTSLDIVSGTPAGGTKPDGAPGLSLRYHLALSDAVALTLAWIPLTLLAGADRGRHLLCAVAAILASLAAMQMAGLYRSLVCGLHSRDVVRVLFAALVGGLVFVACDWLAGAGAAGVGLAGTGSSAVLILTFRWRFGRWLKGRHSMGRHLRPTILVGTNEDAAALWKMLTDEPELGYSVVGVVGEREACEPLDKMSHSFDVGALSGMASRTGADSVSVVAGALRADAAAAAVSDALAAGLDVQIWPGFSSLSSRRLQFAPVSGIPVLRVEPPRAPAWQKMTKRAMDIGLTAAVAPVVVPVLLVAALRIKLEDGGPILYHNSVVGQDGKPITVLKLRTMVPNAAQMLADLKAMNERTGGPLFKASHDPRVTKIGRILRATSIDELPQLWNVFTGTMSLVGPRPALPHEDVHFDAELRRRYQMRPGITGLWQSEARDNPAFSAYQRLDLFYVDNWSIGLDVAILANTAHAVVVRAIRAILPAGPGRDDRPASGDLLVSPLAVPELASVDGATSE